MLSLLATSLFFTPFACGALITGLMNTVFSMPSYQMLLYSEPALPKRNRPSRHGRSLVHPSTGKRSAGEVGSGGRSRNMESNGANARLNRIQLS